jgi:hypothetical protein
MAVANSCHSLVTEHCAANEAQLYQWCFFSADHVSNIVLRDHSFPAIPAAHDVGAKEVA